MEKCKGGRIEHFTDIEAWKIGREVRKSYVFRLLKRHQTENKERIVNEK